MKVVVETSADYLLNSQYQTTFCGLRHTVNFVSGHILLTETSPTENSPTPLRGSDHDLYFNILRISTSYLDADHQAWLPASTFTAIASIIEISQRQYLLDRTQSFRIRWKTWCTYQISFITITGFILWTSSSPISNNFQRTTSF